VECQYCPGDVVGGNFVGTWNHEVAQDIEGWWDNTTAVLRLVGDEDGVQLAAPLLLVSERSNKTCDPGCANQDYCTVYPVGSGFE